MARSFNGEDLWPSTRGSGFDSPSGHVPLEGFEPSLS